MSVKKLLVCGRVGGYRAAYCEGGGNRTSVWREVEGVTKESSGSRRVLSIFELCLMNFDETFLIECGALKKDGGREMSGSYNFYLWTGTLEKGPREEN